MAEERQARAERSIPARGLGGTEPGSVQLVREANCTCHMTMKSLIQEAQIVCSANSLEASGRPVGFQSRNRTKTIFSIRRSHPETRIIYAIKWPESNLMEIEYGCCRKAVVGWICRNGIRCGTSTNNCAALRGGADGVFADYLLRNRFELWIFLGL
jgi:hypothetical protein